MYLIGYDDGKVRRGWTDDTADEDPSPQQVQCRGQVRSAADGRDSRYGLHQTSDVTVPVTCE